MRVVEELGDKVDVFIQKYQALETSHNVLKAKIEQMQTEEKAKEEKIALLSYELEEKEGELQKIIDKFNLLNNKVE